MGGVTATECGSWMQYISGSCDSNRKTTFAGKRAPQERGKYYFRIEVD